MTNDSHQNAVACFEGQPLMALLGARLADVGPGTAVVALDLGDAHAQHNGVTHAGVMLSIAGTASACAALAQWPADRSVVGVQLGIQLLAPAPLGQRLEARAHVLQAGRKIAATHADLVVVDGEETRVAVVTGTMRGIRTTH